MRDIGSNKITGSEAILTVAIVWWMNQGPDFRKIVSKSLETADPSVFLDKTDIGLGHALSTVIPTSSIVQSFWDLSSRNPTMKFMIEQAVKSWRSPSIEESIVASKNFVKRTILSELGSYVKETTFLEENAGKIRRAKRRSKE